MCQADAATETEAGATSADNPIFATVYGDAEADKDDSLPTSGKMQRLPSHQDDYNGFWARQFKRMARSAWLHLIVTLVISLVLSGLAMTVGGFEVSVDNAGWQSRGTLIADRQAQLLMANLYQDYLFEGGSDVWENVLNNVQPGWETDDDSEDDRRRRLTMGPAVDLTPSKQKVKRQVVPFALDHRLLQNTTYLDGCDTSWYLDWARLEYDTHLWPIWKVNSDEDSVLHSDIVHDLCVSELNTQAILEERGLCFGCEVGCLPPYSIVLYARLVIPDGFDMDCQTLSEEWSQYEAATETEWAQCVADIKATYDPNFPQQAPDSCPMGFSPYLVDANFDTTAWTFYSSSIFATSEKDVDTMYNIIDQFDHGTDKLKGAYDTQHEDFGSIFTENAVSQDMTLACGSAFITTLAMIVHTRSPLITIIGLLQIILSFPLSFFVYTFFGQLEFFPFLNFIGVFVVFALGADNVFVATDKWKNARIANPNSSYECIAAIALPDAAGAMLLTTSTTAIAFFGTAICPVAPIKLFAIFCGLLIMFDYILCVLLVFPALCIYGRRLENKQSNCCIACHCCHNTEASNDDEDKQSLIRRILLSYYTFLHKGRYVIFIICLGGLGISTYFATTLELPTSSDVRIMDEDIEYEQNYAWRQNLLYDRLNKSGGSDVMVGFGVKPADTGDLSDPSSWTQLVLDESFDPSSVEAQSFLLSFCDNLFNEEFTDLPSPDYVCPFNLFSEWVKEQAASANPVEAYTSNCGGAQSIPIPEENLHACLIAWSYEADDSRVLSYEGKVKIIIFEFAGRVRWDSPFNDLDDEWHLIEDWFKSMSAGAPVGVSRSFFSSEDYWWYDTNVQMLSTAYGAAGIALGAAAAIILFSSRSFTLTFFAVVTIAYVLTSVTATLVGFGWTLGFLESVCFAILIGVSVDFVIHFTHSYSHFKGEHSRAERTQHALVEMGPSILAAAFTTIAAATIMLFTVITFFQKFALILFMTIVQATVGSFIVFLTIADCFGPSDPTAVFDKFAKCCSSKDQTSREGH